MDKSNELIKKVKDLEKQAKNLEKLAYDFIRRAPLKHYAALNEYDWDVLPSELTGIQNTLISSYRNWYYSVLNLIKQFFPNEIERFEKCYENKSDKGYEFGVLDILHLKSDVYNMNRSDVIKNFQGKFHVQVGLLSSIKVLDINDFKKDLIDAKISVFQKLDNLLLKFHEVALNLRNRVSRPSRKGFEINDEYDVQDLLHALLIIEFDDVRTEEYVPSYAGNNSRVDFFLKNETIFIETKKTREDLRDKKLVEELIIDIQFYQKHPDCKILYCFIYDPDDLIRNRAAIINELSKDLDDFKVKIMISPMR